MPNTDKPKTAIEMALTALEAAKTEVEATEVELVRVLAETTTAGKRAEKVAVSSVIETALTRLRNARRKVVDAEDVLATEELANRTRAEAHPHRESDAASDGETQESP